MQLLPIRRSLYRSFSLCVVVSVICIGCGKDVPVQPAQVRGVVTFQGQPLSSGTIVFAPDRERGGSGKPIAATIEPDGTYRLIATGSAGIPPGWYRIAIAEPAIHYQADTLSAAFPDTLRRPDLSGLEREVKAGKDNLFDFLIELTP